MCGVNDRACGMLGTPPIYASYVPPDTWSLDMRPELPDYGTFPRWPADGTAWIHPDDRATVMHLIPGERVFRRERFDGTFYHYRYGDLRFRLKPCMWLPLSNEGIDIGDLVETIGLGMERELYVGTVAEAIYSESEGRCLYRLARAGSLDDRFYGREDLQVLTDKTKLREGTTIHPTPQWVASFQDEQVTGERLHLPTDIEPDDRAYE
jgi:hypothetical protein